MCEKGSRGSKERDRSSMSLAETLELTSLDTNKRQHEIDVADCGVHSWYARCGEWEHGRT